MYIITHNTSNGQVSVIGTHADREGALKRCEEEVIERGVPCQVFQLVGECYPVAASEWKMNGTPKL